MKKLTILLSTFLFLLSSCAPRAIETTQTLTVMTHDSFSVSEEVVAAFETANNAKVTFLQSGDAGSVLNKAILTRDAPLADVLPDRVVPGTGKTVATLLKAAPPARVVRVRSTPLATARGPLP